jgi:hypothetical protein
VKCYTFHIAKQQLIILSRTVQPKDCITVSRMRFAHAPPLRLGPRSYLLYSSASVQSRGKTLVFTRRRQFLVLQLSCTTNFFKEMNFLLMQLLRNFKKTLNVPAVFLPRHNSSTHLQAELPDELLRAPLSGCATAASSYLSTTPTPSCSVDLAPSPSGSGRMTRSSPLAASQGLHRSGRHTWQSTPPRHTARQAPRWSHRHQEGLVFRPAGFFAFLFSGATKRRSRNHFSGHKPVSCTPWTGGAVPVSTAALPTPSAVTASEMGPLTSPPAGRHQSSGEALWRPGYTLADGQTSWCTLAPLYSPCI